jgi:cellulose synthase/poly-beta-1,6-N-acetylglucosamine synthase-like glycosyltransferase
VRGLARARPDLSASQPAARWHFAALFIAATALVAALLCAPDATKTALVVVTGMPFACVALVRLTALRCSRGEKRRPNRARPLAPPLSPDPLPVYSVLVPLYREERTVEQLIAMIGRLDYPPERLDVLLVTEADDKRTATALAAVRLPQHFRVVVVPPGQPRTKPRALNFALQYARGDYVVIYDAEDAPEADQLRRALALLRSDPRIGCVQARLNVYNRNESFFTRQFTIEYTAHFDAILPALARLDLPLPLGGTSNHFPRAVLSSVGAWDPYNVTEDADLGLRLARMGYRIRLLDSTTWEEAPARFPVWLRQRTRWLKGWMQTWIVHMRHPARLLRELGLRRFAGLQVLLAAMVLAGLLHPVFLALFAFDLFTGAWGDRPAASPAERAVWWLAMGNLTLGYGSAVLLGAVAAGRRGWRALSRQVVFMPLYWLAMSIAAWRALWQLAIDPYTWEKTQHRGCAPAYLRRAAPPAAATSGGQPRHGR